MSRSGTCGNGQVDEGEACDDGNADNADACRNNCTEVPIGSTRGAAAESCQSILASRPLAPNGLYWLNPGQQGAANAVHAYCRMAIAGGGWIRAVQIERDDLTWNAWSTNYRSDFAHQNTGSFGLRFNQFSDQDDGEDLEYLIAVDGNQTGNLYRAVNYRAWDHQMGNQIYDTQFEYSEPNSGVWQNCSAGIRHNGDDWAWSIADTTTRGSRSCASFDAGNGFLIHGNPNLNASKHAHRLYGLNRYFIHTQFTQVRIYVRRSL
jgi:cysteine-rich repeat protein